MASTDGHSLFPPSASSRWLRCPGSAVLAAGMPMREPGAAAMTGTRAHLVAEAALRRRPLPQCTAKEAKLAAPFIAHVNKLAMAQSGRTYVFAEERVNILPLCWGTADAIIFAPETGALHILDLKTGKYPVSPDATQLRLYAAGALHSFPAARFICGWVVQPQVSDEPSFSTYETWELLGLLTLAKRAIDKAKENANAALRVGDWCRFCPARMICPALNSQLLSSIPSGNLDDDTDYSADFD